MSNSYLILDLETGSHESYLRKGNPFDPRNKIVAVGIKVQGYDEPYALDNTEGRGLNRFEKILTNPLQEKVTVIVGHNIKFDLLYLWNNKVLQNWLKAGGKIYDTQLGEYILSGQRHKYPSLREIAVNKYGCKERPKHMEEYWDRGIDTSDIPKELVLEDVENDVLDTEQILLQQIPELKKQGMYQLAIQSMEGLLATTEMEANGLYINREIFQSNKQRLQEEIKEIESDLETLTRRHWK